MLEEQPPGSGVFISHVLVLKITLDPGSGVYLFT